MIKTKVIAMILSAAMAAGFAAQTPVLAAEAVSPSLQLSGLYYDYIRTSVINGGTGTYTVSLYQGTKRLRSIKINTANTNRASFTGLTHNTTYTVRLYSGGSLVKSQNYTTMRNPNSITKVTIPDDTYGDITVYDNYKPLRENVDYTYSLIGRPNILGSSYNRKSKIKTQTNLVSYNIKGKGKYAGISVKLSGTTRIHTNVVDYTIKCQKKQDALYSCTPTCIYYMHNMQYGYLDTYSYFTSKYLTGNLAYNNHGGYKYNGCTPEETAQILNNTKKSWTVKYLCVPKRDGQYFVTSYPTAIYDDNTIELPYNARVAIRNPDGTEPWKSRNLLYCMYDKYGNFDTFNLQFTPSMTKAILNTIDTQLAKGNVLMLKGSSLIYTRNGPVIDEANHGHMIICYGKDSQGNYKLFDPLSANCSDPNAAGHYVTAGGNWITEEFMKYSKGVYYFTE